jgi:Ca2+-binding EF-hand superfamily protein
MQVGAVNSSSQLYALLAAGPPAQARKPPPLAGKSLSDLDTDGDGSISQAELAGALAQNAPAGASTDTADAAANLLKRIDTDGDGKISADEWNLFQQRITSSQHRHGHGSGLAGKKLSDVDTDGDGSISQDELTSAMAQNAPAGASAKLFKRLDANGDGKLSADEWNTFQQRLETMQPGAGLGGQDSSAGALTKAELQAWFMQAAAGQFQAGAAGTGGAVDKLIDTLA